MCINIVYAHHISKPHDYISEYAYIIYKIFILRP
jgi:hypothetical protein